MRNLYILISFVMLFFLGCITTPEITSTTEHGDIEAISLKVLNESNLS